jgi:hypothetical protein
MTTPGAMSVALCVLHLTGHVTGWYWPVVYVTLFLIAVGQEQYKKN